MRSVLKRGRKKLERGGIRGKREIQMGGREGLIGMREDDEREKLGMVAMKR